MLSPLPSDTIAWYRPVKFIRGFLSMSVWVPLANLTYSSYLFHPFIMLACGMTAQYILANGRDVPEMSQDCFFNTSELINMWLITFGLSLFITLLISVFIFMLIEKQGINARSAFKNKFEKLQINQSLLGQDSSDA